MKQRKALDARNVVEKSAQLRDGAAMKNPFPGVYSLVMWCIGLWFLLLASTPFFLVEKWRLSDLPDLSLMGQRYLKRGGVWDPWLASVADSMQLAEVLFLLGSLVAAFLLASNIVRTNMQGMLWILVLSVMVGLSRVEPRPTLASLACVWLIGILAERTTRCHSISECWQSFALAASLFLLSVLSTLEVGWIATALTLLVVLPVAKRYQTMSKQWMPSIGIAVCWVGLVLSPSLFGTGYLGALLRPISWMWNELPTELLPSMTPVWRANDFGWHHWTAMTLFVECWRRIFLGRANLSQMLLWALLTVIGLGCARYFWLAVATLLLTDQRTQRPEIAGAVAATKAGSNGSGLVKKYETKPWVPGMTATVVGCLALVLQLAANTSTVLASDVIVRTLAPSQWNVSGIVMLSNLEHVSDWQGRSLRSAEGRYQYRPVITDRWDVFHADYSNYLAIYQDWTNWKREAYLRSDGSWGGYQAVFSEWDPVLVAVDARDLEGIHTVSLDSQWKVIGVDPKKVVFARTESEAAKPYIQYANRALATLEFPRPGGDIDFQRVVALGGRPQETLQVSASLTSLRLPFAGLRVLPSDGSAQHSASSVLALTELAHRTFRYSGTFSILDNVRALGNSKFQPTSDERVTESVSRYLANLKRKLEGISETEVADPIAQVRRQLKLGKLSQAQAELSKMESSTATEFYQILLSAADVSAATTLSRLQGLPLSELPTALASECRFYQGCLANEVGDVGQTQSALIESLELDSNSPFASVASFYLSQIGFLEPNTTGTAP